MARTEDSHVAKAQEITGRQDTGLVDPVDMGLPEPMVAVPVRNESPALGVARCVTLSAANPVKLLLPQDPRRRGAVILSVDNDVYVASSLELAQAAEGSKSSEFAFYLPAGIGIPVENKAALWVAATTTATSSRVSVMISKDDQ